MTANQSVAATPGKLAFLRKRLPESPAYYPIVGVFGGFAIAYVTARTYVPGDAATTAANVLADSGLVRIGVVADLLQATVFVFLAMTLYLVLKDVNWNVAKVILVYRSGMYPKAFRAVLIVVGRLLSAGHARAIPRARRTQGRASLPGHSTAIAEIWMVA